jgi:hypothetical protein
MRRGMLDLTRTPSEGSGMELYAIIRRDGWASGPDLEAAAARSSAVGDGEMPEDIRWIRSYVLVEEGGGLGTVCIYEASSPEAIRDHAVRADLPVTEIVPIADTVIVRPDPAPAAA